MLMDFTPVTTGDSAFHNVHVNLFSAIQNKQSRILVNTTAESLKSRSGTPQPDLGSSIMKGCFLRLISTCPVPR